MSWMTFDNPAAGPDQVAAYSAALDALHKFHDAFSSAAPGTEMLDLLSADLRRWTTALAPMAVPEVDRLSGRIKGLPVRGHLAIPPVLLDVSERDRVEGTVTFGPYFLGGGSAAHGGIITMVFDEVLGIQASAGGRRAARTAYLRTDFRSIVPIDVPVRVRAWFEREEGRKRYIRGDMRVGDTLCAEVDSLFVELRDQA
jgi:acyl-coenzyme A thioesterase PaaI-like protein